MEPCVRYHRSGLLHLGAATSLEPARRASPRGTQQLFVLPERLLAWQAPDFLLP